jgi:DNA-binding transcriptional LysR family regulator
VNLHDIDLNLLVALDVLLEEESVTRAARRLHITQSAMSQTLGRLRELLGDPLLVRQGRQMRPTALAQELVTPLRQTLRQVRALLQHRPTFDPSRDQRHVTLATTDFTGGFILPGLMEHFGARSPGLSLRLVLLDVDHLARDLDQGAYDMAISVVSPSPGLEVEPLFHASFATLARPGHPWLARPTAAHMCEYGHVVMSPQGRGKGTLGIALEALGLSREVVLRVPEFSLGPPALLQTDLLMTLPEHLATCYSAAYGLQVAPTPVPLPGYTISKAWATRASHDPALHWLRQRLREAAST